MFGHTFSRTRFHRRRSRGERRAWKRRRDSSASASACSSSGSDTTRPALVADDAQLADLGEREQPLVLRIRAADAAEQVHVGRRRDPLERELRHPPQVQPLGHFRVHELQIAVELPADAVDAAPQRDRVGGGDAAPRRRQVEHDPLDDRRDVRVLQRPLQPRRELVVRGDVGAEVDVDRIFLRVAGRATGDRAGDVVEVVDVDERGGEVVAAAVLRVARGDVRGAVAGDRGSRTRSARAGGTSAG